MFDKTWKTCQADVKFQNSKWFFESVQRNSLLKKILWYYSFKGFWGEIRNWKDGTTLVQKTHDASEHHVLHVRYQLRQKIPKISSIKQIKIINQQDFGGHAILVVRNPYDAILSTHNFLYAGHHAKAPIKNYEREGNYF